MSKFLIFTLGFIILPICFYGQTVDLRFKDFRHNDELISFQVSDIAQDKLGFIWLGTNNGLLRYDGYDLKKYLSAEGLNYGLNEKSVYKLFTDRAGELWISLNSNFCRYDYHTDSIKVIANALRPKGLKSTYISNYAEDKDSVLHVSDSDVIYQYQAKRDSFIPVFTIDNGTISNFLFDNDNNIWVSCADNGGIYFFDTTTRQYITLEIPPHLVTNQSVSDIVIHRNKLWIATENDGAISYNLESKHFKKYPTSNEYELNIRNLYVDKDDFLWMIDFTSLKLYVEDRDFFQGYYPDHSDNYSVKPFIHNIFQDRDHNYWTTHYPGGIGFAPKPLGIDRFDSKTNSPFHLNTDNLSAICEDEQGNLWMGNPFNGIDIFKWDEGRTIQYNHHPNHPNSLGKGAIQTIFRDSQERMWVGSYWGGLQKYRPKTNDFYSFQHDPSNRSSISANDVRAIAEDSEGNLWICLHGKGVDHFNPNTGKFTNYNTENSGLSNDYTLDITISDNDDIWVGTVWGVSVMRKGEQKFSSYYFAENDTNTITSNSIYTVYADELNRIWVGTNTGLNLYLPESDNFKRFTDGFANINIVSITSDSDNNIWMGTFSGLSRLNTKTGNILNLNKSDGLISNNFTPRAVYKNDENSLFFGTFDGLNYFNPALIQINNLPPKVFITKFKIFNQETNLHNSSFFTKNIIATDHVKLNYKQKVIDIEFTALNYSSDKSTFAYYLDGFEKTWNYSSDKRMVTYTNLKPGSYIFRAKAANSEGIWNETGTQLKIEITPPFWGTIWFKILVVLAIIIGTSTFIHLRERQLINDSKELEYLVNERTKEIIEQNIKLEYQKKELEKANEIKSKFFSILAHDLRSPISSLVQLTGLLKNQKDHDQIYDPRIIDITASTAADTMKLLEDLLVWGNSQSDHINLIYEKLNLYKIVKHAASAYKENALRKSIEIAINIPTDVFVTADANTFKVVVRNLLSNAIKFSYQNSKIEIGCEIINSEAVVSVKDHGVGMDSKLINEFSEGKIKHSGKGTLGETGTGLGLSICKELAEQNKGKIWIESKPGQGTTFFFTIPLAS